MGLRELLSMAVLMLLTNNVKPLSTSWGQKVKNIQFSKNSIPFIPKYTVLYNNASTMQEGMYVRVENMTSTKFHLFGEKYPNTDNYQFSIIDDSPNVEKCPEGRTCYRMLECDTLVLDENLNNARDVVYIYWKINSDRSLTILMGFTNYTVKCEEVNPFAVQRLVMHSSEKQNISTVQSISDENGSWTTTEISLGREKYFVTDIIPCPQCQFQFNLNCNSKLEDSITKIGCSERFQIFLPNKSRTQPLTKCSLEITIQTEENRRNRYMFWQFGRSFAVVHLVSPDPTCEFILNDDTKIWQWKSTFSLVQNDIIFVATERYSLYNRTFSLVCNGYKDVLQIPEKSNNYRTPLEGAGPWFEFEFPLENIPHASKNCSFYLHENPNPGNTCPTATVWLIKRSFIKSTSTTESTAVVSSTTSRPLGPSISPDALAPTTNSDGGGQNSHPEDVSCSNNNHILMVCLIILCIYILLDIVWKILQILSGKHVMPCTCCQCSRTTYAQAPDMHDNL